jgi:hypothetical protein
VSSFSYAPFLKLTLYRTARTAKIAQTQKRFDEVYGKDKVEVVGVDDLIGGDFSSALEGQQIWSVSNVSSLFSDF